jgi:hypothetical protein
LSKAITRVNIPDIMGDVISMYPSESSARVLLRLPRGLHDQIKRVAAEEGVSANTLMAMLLAGAIGYTLDVRPKEGRSMQDALKSTVNAEAFAQAIGANGRTFRRWLRRRGESVGQGSEYDLPTPDSPAGRELAAQFHAR